MPETPDPDSAPESPEEPTPESASGAPSESGLEAASGTEPEAAPPDPSEVGPVPPQTCCPIRRKVLVGIFKVLSEEECGVTDSELADVIRFDLETPSGRPVLSFRYCPWCGSKRGQDAETRITDIGFGDPTQGDGGTLES